MAASMIRVLLVDDDAAFLESLEALLASDQQVEIVGKALSGEEALEIAAANEPDVAVVDVRMPGMSGIECGRLLRERDSNSRVILISGSIFDDQLPDRTESRALVEVMAAPEARD